LVAGAVAVTGMALAAVLFIAPASSAWELVTGPLTRLSTPGHVTLELPAGAKRTIYQQVREDSRPIAVPATAVPSCGVALVGGAHIDVGAASSLTLTRDGDRYEALEDFEVGRAGSYRVSCSDRSDPRRRIPLAIGETIGLWELLGRLAGSLVALFGGLAVATAIATVTAVRRDSHKRRIQRAHANAPPPAP
jgi:hypothetical protein